VPRGTGVVFDGDDVGIEACEECEPFRLEKEVIMCFDFRAPVVTRLVRQITSRSPGRLAMYTPKEARVKVLTYPLSSV
jgi:hypothetical protein